jgi:membrane-associated phospholipid phosphatase
MDKRIPTRRQWIMMAYLPIHFAWFLILKATITTNYFPMHCALDDLIPFCAGFVFPYLSWFLYMIFTGLYFLLKDEESFEHFMLSLILGFFTCTLICSVFPNGQDLRPTSYAGNFAAQLVKLVQEQDTNKTVFPSMHIVGALSSAVAIATSKTLRNKKWLQFLSWTLCVAIMLATVFIKQHSALDVFGGMAVCAVVFFVVYKGYASKLLTKLEGALTRKKTAQ